MVAESIRRILEGEVDMEVIAIATSVTEALDEARTNRPDVVLMDYLLPDGNGVTATTRILAENTPKIVLLTGSGAEGALPAAMAAGCVGYVEKTNALAELLPAVRAAVALIASDDHPQPIN